MVSLNSEDIEILRKLGDWSEILEFATSGSFVTIKKPDIDAFVMFVEKSYDEWLEKKKGKLRFLFLSATPSRTASDLT